MGREVEGIRAVPSRRTGRRSHPQFRRRRHALPGAGVRFPGAGVRFPGAGVRFPGAGVRFPSADMTVGRNPNRVAPH